MQRELSVLFEFLKDRAQQMFQGYFGAHITENRRRALQYNNGTKTTEQ